MSDADVSRQVGSLIPAALTHEIYHHIFYRPEVASSGFVLEGEATAYGEYVHQMIIEGANAKVDDPILLLNRDLAKQAKADPGVQTPKEAEELEKLNELISRRSEKASFTFIQCKCLRIVSSYATRTRGNASFDLGDALTLTSGDLQSRQDTALLYAFAWAIYDKSRRGNSDWDEVLTEVHAKQHAHIGLTEQDKTMLKEIVNETLAWAAQQSKTRIECR
jgi:hypothetical protein